MAHASLFSLKAIELEEINRSGSIAVLGAIVPL